MPHKKWTTDEQEAWFTERLPDFIAAQQDKTMNMFYPPVYEAWFMKFPSRQPTEKEVILTKGDIPAAAAIIRKADREVRLLGCVILLIEKLIVTESSVSIGGSGITRARLRRVRIPGVC